MHRPPPRQPAVQALWLRSLFGSREALVTYVTFQSTPWAVGGEGRGHHGGVPVQQERRWMAEPVRDVCVRERSWSDSSLTPVLHFSFYGLVERLPWTSFRGGLEM